MYLRPTQIIEGPPIFLAVDVAVVPWIAWQREGARSEMAAAVAVILTTPRGTRRYTVPGADLQPQVSPPEDSALPDAERRALARAVAVMDEAGLVLRRVRWSSGHHTPPDAVEPLARLTLRAGGVVLRRARTQTP